MLKKFFLNTLSSFVGAWIALALFGVVAVIVCVGLVAKFGVSSAQSVSISSHSILRLELKGLVEEVEEPAQLDYMQVFNGGIDRPQTLNVITKGIEEGASNRNIDAMYIECGGVSASPATLNAIRQAVEGFKKSGKKVYAYGDNLSMGDYYVASVADSLFLNPGGEVALKGISGTVMYMKELFDKLGVQFQVAKVGTFKSAVEPYIMNEMSAPARAQLDTLYGNMWNYMTESISKTRKKLSPARINTLVGSDLIAWKSSKADVEAGLVDRCVYGREMKAVLANLVGRDPEKLNFVSPSDLVSQTDWGNAYNSKKQIAVLYATGEIADGAPTGINFEKLVPVIVKLADNDKVKGMVLRVNSPGGSAFGSEQIGEALDYFMSKGKTLSVSMGDYAASGGYWISCCADRIFADPLTVTGSIGIFGLIPNFHATAAKVGVNPQTVSTNPQAAFPTGFYPMDTVQMNAVQRYVERGYDKFVGRVAKGRKMSVEQVKRIAEGRVWDARTALKIKLVDQLGSLQDAIDWTASQAKLKSSYEVAVYPQFEPGIWDLIPTDGSLAAIAIIKRYLPDDFDARYLREASKVLTRRPVQALMPVMTVGF